MRLVLKTVDQSPIVLGSSASHSPGTLNAQSSKSERTGTSTERPVVARGVNENAASSSQEWHSNANTNTSTKRPVAETNRWYDVISPQL